jgi:hypothetical protein
MRRNWRLGNPHRVVHDSIVRAWDVIDCNWKATKMGAGQWRGICRPVRNAGLKARTHLMNVFGTTEVVP